jgi:hypothetical protein
LQAQAMLAQVHQCIAARHHTYLAISRRQPSGDQTTDGAHTIYSHFHDFSPVCLIFFQNIDGSILSIKPLRASRMPADRQSGQNRALAIRESLQNITAPAAYFDRSQPDKCIW